MGFGFQIGAVFQIFQQMDDESNFGRVLNHQGFRRQQRNSLLGQIIGHFNSVTAFSGQDDDVFVFKTLLFYLLNRV